MKKKTKMKDAINDHCAFVGIRNFRITRLFKRREVIIDFFGGPIYVADYNFNIIKW